MSTGFPTLKIFVIHSEQDDYIIQELENYFEEQVYGATKFEIKYLDSRRGLSIGEDFGKKIMELIDNADYVFIIVSRFSKISVWVNQEIGYVFGLKCKNFFCIVEDKYVGQGLGFIHSNIDVQSFKYGTFDITKIHEKFEHNHGPVSRPYPMEVKQFVV